MRDSPSLPIVSRAGGATAPDQRFRPGGDGQGPPLLPESVNLVQRWLEAAAGADAGVLITNGTIRALSPQGCANRCVAVCLVALSKSGTRSRWPAGSTTRVLAGRFEQRLPDGSIVQI